MTSNNHLLYFWTRASGLAPPTCLHDVTHYAPQANKHKYSTSRTPGHRTCSGDVANSSQACGIQVCPLRFPRRSQGSAPGALQKLAGSDARLQGLAAGKAPVSAVYLMLLAAIAANLSLLENLGTMLHDFAMVLLQDTQCNFLRAPNDSRLMETHCSYFVT